MDYKLPELAYTYDALEPHFDRETMVIHYERHHQASVDNLNKAIAGTIGENKDLEEVLRKVSKYGPAVRNNGGGHYNHTLFWETLSATPRLLPEETLARSIANTFGSLDNLKAEIKSAGLRQFGSGWA